MTMSMGTTKGAPGTPRTSLLPSPSSPLVTFRIQFRAGAIDDPAGKEGLNTLTAMTIGESGTGKLTYREVVDRLFPMAASIQAQPDREVTTFVGEVHRDHLKAFYRLFKDVLLTPRFDPGDFSRSRDLLLAALQTNLRGNDDENLGKETLNWFMYQGHPCGRPDLGTVQGLKAITLEDVRKHYAALYRRGSVTLGVAGGYPDELIESMRADFVALPEGAPNQRELPKPPPIKGMEIVFVEKPAHATAISMGYPIDVTRADEDFYALMIANSYLGEHRTFNGRLMNSMRGERGLNYGDYSYIETFLQDGGTTLPLPNIPRRQQDFTIWIRPVPRANALFALRQVARELRMLVDKGLSVEDFEATRSYLMNYSRLWTQSLSRRLGCQMDSEFYGAPYFIDQVQKILPALTLEKVNAAVKAHLNALDIKVAIVTEGAEELRQILLSGKPTPITYQTPTTDERLLAEDREIESFPLPVDATRVRVVKAQSLFER
jgi:zinc protease